MKNDKKQTLHPATGLVIGIAVIISLASLALSLYNLFRFQSYDAASIGQQTRMQTAIAEIRFCHDRQITPCDDISLKDWDAKHPTDTINIIH